MRRGLFLAAFAALAILGCTQESTDISADVEIWDGELPIRQPWLRDQLPEQSLIYMRVPNILGLVAMPKGNVLDPALRSTANIETVDKIRQGLIDNVLGEIPALTEARIDLFNEYIRSPIEISGIFIPAPTSLIAMTLDVDSNEAFDAMLDEVGFALAAPLDENNVGQIEGLGMPVFVRFEAATGRLLLQTGPGANATAFAKALEAMASSGTHPMHRMESKIDASGQGLFLWINAEEAMPMMQMFMPREQLQTLIDMGLEEVSAMGLGWGVANGKSRLSLVVDVPSEEQRGFIPYVSNDLSATSVGDPDALFQMWIPTIEEFERLESMFLEYASDVDAADWQEGKDLIEETVGVPIEDFLGSLGPEFLIILDQVGDYLAIRLRDPALWDSVLDRIAATTGSGPVTKQVGGQTYWHWSMPNEAALAEPDMLDSEISLFISMWARQRDHVYWTREGDFLYMASIPQVLMDRAAMSERREIGEWLTQKQRIDASEAMFSITGTSEKLPQRLYHFYVEVLQMISDVALAEMDVWSMPTAKQLGLPRDGVLGFTVNFGSPTVGVELTFENNPFEMLGGMSGVAVVGIAAAIAIPAYVDYSTRAEIAEGLSRAAAAKAGIAEYYMQYGEYPGEDAAAELSMQDIDSPRVDSILVQPGNGWIIINYREDVANTGGQVILVPTVEVGGSIYWSCSGTFMDKHLPAMCRESDID